MFTSFAAAVSSRIVQTSRVAWTRGGKWRERSTADTPWQKRLKKTRHSNFGLTTISISSINKEPFRRREDHQNKPKNILYNRPRHWKERRTMKIASIASLLHLDVGGECRRIFCTLNEKLLPKTILDNVL